MATCLIRHFGYALFSALLMSPAAAEPETVFFPSADGKTEILRIYHLDRGYDRMESKLTAVGANVRRIKGSGSEQ